MTFSYKVEVLVLDSNKKFHTTSSRVFGSRNAALKEIKKQKQKENAYVFVAVMDTATQKYNRLFPAMNLWGCRWW